MGKKHKKHKVDKKDASGSEAMDPEASSDQTQTQDKGEKPLKLVLKVGHQEASDGFGSTPPEEKTKHKHKKKKKKKEPKEKERTQEEGGYSSIILNPMDFSTMEAKIENNEYRSVMEYKKDFMMMCNNAMTYNRPETVYYKEAKRLVHIGLKQLSKDRLLTLKKTQSWLANLTLAEIGIDEHGKVLEEIPPIPEEQKVKEKPKSKSSKTVQGPFEPFPDSLTPEEILAQAQAASKEARQELSLRKPKTDFTFFRRNKKGVTTMTIMNQDNDGIVSETERVVTLGEMVGKLPAGAGTGTLAGFKEDKRNKVTPITYVNYGPFSSFAPQYDSSFGNVSKEESDLLLATYGDEIGVQYAKSVQNFVDSAGDYAVKMVNNLLDMLTKGQHTRTNMMLEQQRRLEEQKTAEETEANAEAPATPSEKTEAQSPAASSVTAEGEEEDPIQKRLNTTAELIGDLHRTQEARLSQQPPAHLAHCQGPSEREMELATKVTAGLADLSRDAAPGDLDEESMADDTQGDDTLEENLPSAGTASESMGASQATEEEEEGDEDEEEVGEGGSMHDGTAEEGGLETGETADEDEGILSGEAADLIITATAWLINISQLIVMRKNTCILTRAE
nr:hypothetical protein BaRGS_029699 [Batillaria attramentaria]